MELGELACSGLKMHIGRDLQAGVRIALAYYLATTENGDRRIDAPQFDAAGAEEVTGLPLEIDLDSSSEAALEAEAKRQQITLSRLATHSVHMYLARLELSTRCTGLPVSS